MPAGAGSKEKMGKKGKSLRRKKMEGPRQGSTTPPLSARVALQGSREANAGCRPEVVETLRNRQDKVSGAIAAPREVEEEPGSSASWIKSLQRQGPPGSRNGQKPETAYESDTQGKIQGAAHWEKGAPRLTRDEQETHAKPETLGELYGPAPPTPYRAKRRQTVTKKMRRQTG